MATLEEMATKGSTKYRAKIPIMRRNFRAAEDRAKKGYDATPFGPTRKANYKDAWRYMPDNYELKVKEGLEEKWRTKWIEAMRV